MPWLDLAIVGLLGLSLIAEIRRKREIKALRLELARRDWLMAQLQRRRMHVMIFNGINQLN